MTKIDEIWLPVKSYEGIYEISNLGRVKSITRFVTDILNGKERVHRINGCIFKYRVDQKGYPIVKISKNGHYRNIPVHRLIAAAFIENPSNLPAINHINGIKSDNRIENIEWCTIGDNTRHAFASGLIKNKGVDNVSAKLSENQVIEIINSKEPTKNLLPIYGVSANVINEIKRGNRWKHLYKKYKK